MFTLLHWGLTASLSSCPQLKLCKVCLKPHLHYSATLKERHLLPLSCVRTGEFVLIAWDISLENMYSMWPAFLSTVRVNEVWVHEVAKYIWLRHSQCSHYELWNWKTWTCKSFLYHGNKITGQCQNLERPWPRASGEGDNLLVEILQVHKVSLFIVNGASPGFVTWWHQIQVAWFFALNFRRVFKHIVKYI